MSRAQGKLRIPSGSPRGFGSSVPGKGGFGGFAVAHSKSGLAYIADRHDLSDISDANTVVSFKNLLKKDGTTKSRALEELVAYVQAHPYADGGGAEEAVLEAWVHFYPRLSIDDSRKVRELAHTLQSELVKSARKRMEKHMPKIVGPWLAGTYDRDRAVARAAADGLAFILTTDEKARVFYTRLQPQILAYATAALNETPTTLSDMRSSSKEEADLKYYRVVYGSLSLVLALLRKLKAADTDACRADYERFFAAEAVWSNAVARDGHVRRAAYELFWQVLETRPTLLEAQLPRLTRLVTREAPKASQAGSVVDYLKVLTKLSQTHADMWSEAPHPFTRLRPLVERGSQGTVSTPSYSFWQQLDALFASIPPRPIAPDAAADVLVSFRNGVAHREEPRSNAVDGWTAYLSMVRRLLDAVTSEDATRVALVEAHVYPLFAHFLHPPDQSVWTTAAAHVTILTRAALLCARPAYGDVVTSMRKQWATLADELAAKMANSLPEVSKEFHKSQQAIASEADRWFALVADVHRSVQRVQSTSGAPTNSIEDVLALPTLRLVQSAVDLLKKRNYKPFGAAHLVGAALLHAPHLLAGDDRRRLVESLFPVHDADELDLLLASPSAAQLLACLQPIAGIPELADHYKAVFSAIVARLLALQDPETTAKYVALLISDASDAAASVSRSNEALQAYLETACYQTAQGTTQAWAVFNATFASNALAPATGQALAARIVRALGSADADPQSVLTALETMARTSPEYFARDETLHLELVTKLLGMMEMGDSALSAKVLALRALVEHTSQGGPPLLRIIQENLDSTGPDSLEIETLVEQASSIAPTLPADDKETLFPNTNIWMKELLPFFRDGLNPALSLTSSLGGAYLLVPAADRRPPSGLKRDRQGNSVPARMAAYTTKLVAVDGVDVSVLPQAFQVELVYLLYVLVQLGSDQLAVSDTDSLWGDLSGNPFAFETADDAVTTTRALLAKLVVERTQDGDDTFFQALRDTMLQQTRQLTPLAVYTARALGELLQTRQEGRGFTAADESDLVKLGLWKSSPETALGAVAVLSGYGELLASAPSVSNFCNRLISDVAGAQPEKPSALATLVLLNTCMAVYDIGALPAATNRLVFAVKQITSWFGNGGGGDENEDEDEEKEDNGQLLLDGRVAAESCRALQRLLPCIKDIYGPYWERSFKFCIGLWARAPGEDPDLRLPYLHASLKLVAALEAMEDPNDDLQDTITLFAKAKSEGLLRLLALPRARASQPQEIVDALLCRMASTVPLEHVTDLSELYGLVASESRAIQTAGFNILHRAIPAQQGELSLNVILEKKEARLPDELLSLLLDAPTLEAYPDDVLATFPTPVRGYLLAWLLVFDAFRHASAKVRADYADHLGQAGHVAAFLDFAVDVLGHSAAHALNLDKEGLTGARITEEYDLGAADAEPVAERSMHALFVHLYYLLLTYCPGPFKAWYAACRSKQTKVAVEAWTAKYFSPLLTNAALDEVAAWAAAQGGDGDDGGGGGGDDDDNQLLVKISKPAREVVAGYAVDELQASIALRLPANYPLDGVAVTGLNRVAVGERTWQSWLLITQGAIAFAHGRLVDGLATFRRNVLGALRGQTECAICYSIIAADKKMPDKRCGTCKNLFHKTCLYRWFQTSNQNTCPLCRNPISFLGAESRVRRGRVED
ncbi:ring zinc finger protein [Niveomyces insectorum RCEF 264]|uniref:E3 ubiquitin-protein ligase listerin n=1 Tax=Niveomyces insectorum RCEF 264 TaxID=1081102 RepID=A0A162MTU4_9HYPO|nr:ring zinc finger protein [Niveomyces insectorum RCEF 264]